MANLEIVMDETTVELAVISGAQQSDIVAAVAVETAAREAADTAHAALDTGVHGVDASTVASAADVTTAITAHNASATAHGLTANNWDALQGDALPLILGTPGTIDGELVLGSDNREDFAFTVFQADFSGNADPILFHGYNPPNSTGYNSAEQSIYTGYEGYYWIGASEQYAEWYVEYKNPGATVTRRPFQTTIRLNTNYVNSYIYADNLIIGSGDGLTNYWQILSGVATFQIPTYVIGSSDAIQFLIRGYSTQTNYLLVVDQSDGDDLFVIDNDGKIVSASYTSGTAAWTSFQQQTYATTSTYAESLQMNVYRDGSGPTFSWTYGFESNVFIRANSSGNSLTRFAAGGIFSITVEAASPNTANISVSANIIQVNLTKSGTGTKLVAAPHGVHIGDMGGTGSYAPAGIYIEAQTSPTSGANLAINSVSGRVLLGGLPTAAAGLAAGELWNNGGVINIVT